MHRTTVIAEVDRVMSAATSREFAAADALRAYERKLAGLTAPGERDRRFEVARRQL